MSTMTMNPTITTTRFDAFAAPTARPTGPPG